MIRSLDILPGERWTPGRVAIHMALASAPEATLRAHRPRGRRLWRYLAVAYITPSAFALAVIAALWILRRGL